MKFVLSAQLPPRCQVHDLRESLTGQKDVDHCTQERECFTGMTSECTRTTHTNPWTLSMPAHKCWRETVECTPGTLPHNRRGGGSPQSHPIIGDATSAQQQPRHEVVEDSLTILSEFLLLSILAGLSAHHLQLHILVHDVPDTVTQSQMRILLPRRRDVPMRGGGRMLSSSGHAPPHSLHSAPL